MLYHLGYKLIIAYFIRKNIYLLIFTEKHICGSRRQNIMR